MSSTQKALSIENEYIYSIMSSFTANGIISLIVFFNSNHVPHLYSYPFFQSLRTSTLATSSAIFLLGSCPQLIENITCQSIAVIEENAFHPEAALYADSEPAGTFSTE